MTDKLTIPRDQLTQGTLYSESDECFCPIGFYCDMKGVARDAMIEQSWPGDLPPHERNKVPKLFPPGWYENAPIPLLWEQITGYNDGTGIGEGVPSEGAEWALVRLFADELDCELVFED